jgi:hypothetical protein
MIFCLSANSVLRAHSTPADRMIGFVNGLPRVGTCLMPICRAFTPELYQQKCSTLFEHFYESYPESGAGVYIMA